MSNENDRRYDNRNDRGRNGNNQGNNQGGRRGGGGRQQGPRLQVLDFVFSAKRSDGEIQFLVLEGNRPKPNAEAEFYLGNETLKYLNLLQNADRTPWKIVTGNDGVGRGKLDMSFFGKEYTRLTLVMSGVAHQTIDLPNDEPVPGKAMAPPKPKRLVWKVSEEPLKSRNNRFSLTTIQTQNKDGKTSAEELLFRASEPVTLIDLQTGNEIARDQKFFSFKTAANGLLFAECEFKGLARTLTVVHVESGEEASQRMMFER